jgi:hypothetical protein
VPHPLSRVLDHIHDPSLVVINVDAAGSDVIYRSQPAMQPATADQVLVQQDRLSSEAREAVCERFCSGR